MKLWGWRPVLFLVVVMGASAVATVAQEPPAAADETPRAPAPRPGMWQIGPFYLTPKFRIGSVGLDTNVLYTPTERTTDISASGGPGLELVLPLGGSGRFYAESYLDYIYFVKTKSQRRLTGTTRGGFEFKTARTSLTLEEYRNETFARPSFEVNQRVQQTIEGTRLNLKRRLFGRISLTGQGERSRSVTGDDAVFLGADLQKTLTVDNYRAGSGFDYAITVKTSFVVEYERDWFRYPLDGLRDSDADRIWAGFRTDPSALIAGQALVGRRFFKFKNVPVSDSATVVDLDGLIKITPKTRLGSSYATDLAYSALPTVGVDPLIRQRRYGARIEKDLARNVDVRLFGSISRIESKNPVRVVVPAEGLVVRLRDDKYQQAGIDLGYHFRPRLRIGVTAAYGYQTATIDYFGVKGLMVGGTIRFNP